jgi:N-acyl-L-homoserine lactone synthetase
MPQGKSQEAMMMQLVTHDLYGEFVDDPAEMHRLRYRVFKERLGWDVQVSGDMEIDEFDALHPAYLLQRAPMTVCRDACACCRPPDPTCCAILSQRFWTGDPLQRARRFGRVADSRSML